MVSNFLDGGKGFFEARVGNFWQGHKETSFDKGGGEAPAASFVSSNQFTPQQSRQRKGKKTAIVFKYPCNYFSYLFLTNKILIIKFFSCIKKKC